jgi:PilZ domain
MLFGQGQASENGQEKRGARRFGMKLPASVRMSGVPSEFLTETENVSARGILFYVDRHLDREVTEGARMEVTMAFPPQVTLTDPVRVKFLARVVRVWPEESATRVGVATVGVAAAIEEYEFLRSSDDSPNSPGMQPGWRFSG